MPLSLRGLFQAFGRSRRFTLRSAQGSWGQCRPVLPAGGRRGETKLPLGARINRAFTRELVSSKDESESHESDSVCLEPILFYVQVEVFSTVSHRLTEEQKCHWGQMVFLNLHIYSAQTFSLKKNKNWHPFIKCKLQLRNETCIKAVNELSLTFLKYFTLTHSPTGLHQIHPHPTCSLEISKRVRRPKMQLVDAGLGCLLNNT